MNPFIRSLAPCLLLAFLTATVASTAMANPCTGKNQLPMMNWDPTEYDASACVDNVPGSVYSNPAQGTWATTTSARDYNHDGYIDGYYDSSSNLTWSATSGGYESGNATVLADEGSIGRANASGVIGFNVARLTNLNTTPTELITGWYLPSVGGNEYQALFQSAFGNNPLQNHLNVGFFKTIGRYVWFENGQILPLQAGETFDPAKIVSLYDIQTNVVVTDRIDALTASKVTYGAISPYVHQGDIFGPDAYVPYDFSYLEGTPYAVTSVPEPATHLLMLAGLLGITGLAQRQRKV